MKHGQYEHQAIRVIHGENGEPWFVAVDVCKVLGIGNTSMSIKALDDDEKTALSITEGLVKQGLTERGKRAETLTISKGLIEQGFSDNSKGAGLRRVSGGRSPP